MLQGVRVRKNFKTREEAIRSAVDFMEVHNAVDQATNEAEVALLNSPLHRKNIMEPRFTRLAIGAVRGPDGKLIYAQIFRAA